MEVLENVWKKIDGELVLICCIAVIYLLWFRKECLMVFKFIGDWIELIVGVVTLIRDKNLDQDEIDQLHDEHF